MARTRSEELGLATALASTTDHGRAEIIANEEGGHSPKVERKTEKAKTDGNPVKKEMAHQEQQSAVDQAWSQVHSAVSAAQTACREEAEEYKDGDPKALFKTHLGHLIDVLKEMSDTDDVFKQMANKAAQSKLT